MLSSVVKINSGLEKQTKIEKWAKKRKERDIQKIQGEGEGEVGGGLVRDTFILLGDRFRHKWQLYFPTQQLLPLPISLTTPSTKRFINSPQPIEPEQIIDNLVAIGFS